jgi:hypothetical protein
MVLRGQDVWRAHPIFKWGFADALPGFREGVLAFGVFVAGEWAYKNFLGGEEHGHHGGHGASSHGGAHHGEGHGSAAAAHGGKAAAATHQ